MHLLAFGKVLHLLQCFVNRKILLAMKVTAIFFIITFLAAGARGHSQSITLSMKNTLVENVFKAIQHQAGYNFVYDHDVRSRIKAARIDIQVDNEDIHITLDICLDTFPFKYTIDDNMITIEMKTVPSDARVDPGNEILRILHLVEIGILNFLLAILIIGQFCRSNTGYNHNWQTAIKKLLRRIVEHPIFAILAFLLSLIEIIIGILDSV
jgi:hypothetical protein